MGVLYAQDEGDGLDLSEGFEGFTPQAGDFSVALLLGRANYLSGISVPNGPGNNSSWNIGTGYTTVAPIQEDENFTNNMVGVEVRYYLTDNIGLKISGGAILEDSPGRVNIPADNDPSSVNSVWIPTYNAIEAVNNVNLNVNIGGEMRQATQFDRLQLYYGLTVPIYYSRQSEYNPAIFFVEDPFDPDDALYTQDIGWRHGTLWASGLQLVGGADYYLMDGFFFGFEIKPASFIYQRKSLDPGQGLPLLETETTHVSFLTQPFLKIGFRF